MSSWDVSWALDLSLIRMFGSDETGDFTSERREISVGNGNPESFLAGMSLTLSPDGESSKRTAWESDFDTDTTHEENNDRSGAPACARHSQICQRQVEDQGAHQEIEIQPLGFDLSNGLSGPDQVVLGSFDSKSKSIQYRH